MVGLLTALKGTDLYDRLKREDRLLEESTGTSVNVVLNFKPEMDAQTLIEGYRRVLTTIYDPTLENYFRRCLTMLEHVKPTPHLVKPVGKHELMAIVKSLRRQLFSRQGPAYLKFIAKVIRDRPRMLPEAIHLAVMGYHFEKVTSQQIAIHDFKEFLAAELEMFKETVSHYVRVGAWELEEIRGQVQELFKRVHTRYESMHDDFRYGVEDALESFRSAVNAQVDQCAHLAAANA